MVTIKNQNVTLQIAEMGGEMQSLVIGGREMLWQGWAGIWSGRAPILFPICGSLQDGKYTYEGKEYSLPQHGFARRSLFVLEKQTDCEATLLLSSNEQTKAVYPFDFELRATYALTEDGVKVTFNVKNTGENTMYFSIGSHEAYYTPEGIDEYDVIFPQNETINSTVVNINGILTDKTYPLMKNSTVLPLYEKYFVSANPVIEDLKSESATLRHRITGKFVRVDFPNKPYLLIWHKPNAPYMCIEPWAGIPDREGCSGRLEEKEAITALAPQDSYEVSHTIAFGENS